MHQHGPKCLEGPNIGSSAWWQELGTFTDLAPPPTPPRKRRRQRSASANLEDSKVSKATPDAPPFRAELVARIRREIADGTYDTPEKWDAALDRLLERLGQE